MLNLLLHKRPCVQLPPYPCTQLCSFSLSLPLTEHSWSNKTILFPLYSFPSFSCCYCCKAEDHVYSDWRTFQGLIKIPWEEEQPFDPLNYLSLSVFRRSSLLCPYTLQQMSPKPHICAMQHYFVFFLSVLSWYLYLHWVFSGMALTLYLTFVEKWKDSKI